MMTPIFSEPTEEDYTLLAGHWAAICALALEELDIDLDETIATLDVLQRIVDDDLVNHEGLAAVGTALGKVMIRNMPGLDWWAVVDESGRHLCLRYEETTLRFNPMLMVSKRVGRNEPVEILKLYNLIREKVEEIGKIAD